MGHPSIYKKTQILFSNQKKKKKRKKEKEKEEPICLVERISWSDEMETRTRRMMWIILGKCIICENFLICNNTFPFPPRQKVTL